MYTDSETFLLVFISAVIVVIVLMQYAKKDYYQFWSPLVILSGTYVYYLILGPIISISEGNTVAYTVDHRPYMFNAWLGGVVSFISLILGFQLARTTQNKTSTVKTPTPQEITNYGFWLFIIGLGFFILIAGSGLVGQLNFLEDAPSQLTGYQGGFRNYFLFGINFFIPAACFLLYGKLNRKGNILILGAALFIAVALYTTSGFRYRLVLLACSLLITYYLARRSKPNLVFLTFLAFTFVVVLGIIGMARQYGRGLDLTKIEGKSNFELFLGGVGESITFQTTGLLMDQVPEIYPHIAWDPIWQSIVFPIPRRIWPEKPSGDYIRVINQLYLINNYLGIGAAVLNYGEYYLAFGWWGIIIGSMILGWIAKRLWLWYQANRENPLVTVTYAVAVSFFYVVISRGYLPQVVMNFFFTVGPCFVTIWLFNRRSKRRSYATGIGSVVHPEKTTQWDS